MHTNKLVCVCFRHRQHALRAITAYTTQSKIQRPVAISHAITPNEKMSDLRVSGLPSICWE